MGGLCVLCFYEIYASDGLMWRYGEKERISHIRGVRAFYAVCHHEHGCDDDGDEQRKYVLLNGFHLHLNACRWRCEGGKRFS